MTNEIKNVCEAIEQLNGFLLSINKTLELVSDNEPVFIIILCIIGALFIYAFTNMVLTHRKGNKSDTLMQNNCDALNKVAQALSEFNITRRGSS